MIQVYVVVGRSGPTPFTYKAAALIKIRRELAEQFHESSNAAVILLGEIEQPIHGRSGPRGVAHPHAFQHRLVH